MEVSHLHLPTAQSKNNIQYGESQRHFTQENVDQGTV